MKCERKKRAETERRQKERPRALFRHRTVSCHVLFSAQRLREAPFRCFVSSIFPHHSPASAFSHLAGTSGQE
ncbi:MAG: hypothetical protein CW338_09200, partial [Clostridiales bacterium]|nr:hypothetical protein [Clostridiales bacterium]